MDCLIRLCILLEPDHCPIPWKLNVSRLVRNQFLPSVWPPIVPSLPISPVSSGGQHRGSTHNLESNRSSNMKMNEILSGAHPGFLERRGATFEKEHTR
jgi:hypothetical protein